MNKPTRIVTVGLIAASFVAVPASAALAAGGYGPGSPTGPAGTPGGFTIVVATQTVTAAGGAVSASVPGATLKVDVPAGAFAQPVQIEITSPDLSAANVGLSAVGFANYQAVSGAGVKVLDSNGQPITGTFTKPITVSLTGPGLGVAGEKALEFTGPTAVAVLPAVLGSGEVTVTLDQDPNLVFANPKSGPAGTVAGATSKTTGLPFTGETDIAVALIAAGVALAGSSVIKRRVAARN